MTEYPAPVLHLIILLATSGSVLTSTIRDADICKTNNCQETAKSILANMDETAHPCINFYKFACGNYMKNEPIPDYLEKIQPLKQLDRQVEQQLKDIIQSIKEDDPQPFQKLLQYYKSCTDVEKLNKNSEKDLLDLFKGGGGWPVLEESWNEASFSWEKTIYHFYEKGLLHTSLINAFYSTDFKNNDLVTIHVDESEIKLPVQILVNGLSDLRVQRYLAFIRDLAVMLGANSRKAQHELKEALDFQIELARIMSTPAEQRHDFRTVYQQTTISELQKLCPNIPWLQYLTLTLRPPIQLRTSDRILIANTGFLPKFCAKLKGTRKRVLANYLFYTAATDLASQLSTRLRNRATAFISEIGLGAATPRWKNCLTAVKSQMHIASSALFIRRVLKKGTKADVLQIEHFIRQRIRHSLEHNSWMDRETRKSAVDKLNAMVSLIAYPDELLDDKKINDYYKELVIFPDSFLKTFLNINKLAQEISSARFKKQASKFDWTGPSSVAASVNGFYSPNENSFTLFAGILQEPFFDAASPKYMNFASMGSIISHEMTHGFDDLGRHFDKNGGYHNWWKPETEEEFVRKSRCFIEQYERYELARNVRLNGSLTLGENIADNGGVKQAFLAYKDWATVNPQPELRLAGLTNFSQRQMFWLSYANTWCAKLRPGPPPLQSLHDTHSPNHLRVNIPLMNIPDFATDFGCPKESPMNPTQKCHIW